MGILNLVVIIKGEGAILGVNLGCNQWGLSCIVVRTCVN